MINVKDWIVGWQRMFLACFEWLPELKDKEILKIDIISGITVALVLVPQSMAYASLAGLQPQYGLYASFLPVVIAAIFGSSRQLATGPVAVVSLMTASALSSYAVTPETYAIYAGLLALIVGVFQLSLGLLRLGILVDFLSHPVVVGFTNAAAIIIGTSQIGKLFGVDPTKVTALNESTGATHTYEKVWNTLNIAIDNSHFYTILMAVLAFAIMIFLKRNYPKIPAVLTAVIVTIIVSTVTDFQGAGGYVVGHITPGLPSIRIPDLAENWQIIKDLFFIAVTISLIGFMEAISIAKAMAAQTRQRLDPNQELFGQGLSNITSCLFQGYAVSGSFSRSAVNISAGAVTGFSSVVTFLVVGVTLMWLTPLLFNLPLATLAAVIIMAVINLVKVSPIIHAWKVQKMDGAVSIITFLLTLYVAPHLEMGLGVGLILSISFYIFRTMRPNFAELSMHPDGTLRDAKQHNLKTCDAITILRFDGTLYFANAGFFETRVLENLAEKPMLRYLIIDAEGMNQMDASGEDMLCILNERLESAGVILLIARAKKQLYDALDNSGFIKELGKEHFFRRRGDALKFVADKMGETVAMCSPLITIPGSETETPNKPTPVISENITQKEPGNTKPQTTIEKKTDTKQAAKESNTSNQNFSQLKMPQYLKRGPKQEELLPVLFLNNVDEGDYTSALKTMLNDDQTIDSIDNLKKTMSNWNKDFKEWVERPLADLNYVYLWADSIDFKLFSNNSKQSILLLMGVNTDGKKELIALEEGDASSVKDWTRCLENTQKRGLSVAKLAISNSESGFFEAVEQLMPKTTCQHCWSYKTDYLLAQLPKAEHTKIKKSLRDIWTCETRVAASKAYTAMTNSLKGHKDAKDTMSACRTQMLNYYDFPTHHWQFIRSTTLLESIFTSVLPKKNEQRQSTKDQNTLLSMIGQLSKVAENRSTKVKGFKLLAEVSNGVKFKDGQSVSK